MEDQEVRPPGLSEAFSASDAEEEVGNEENKQIERTERAFVMTAAPSERVHGVFFQPPIGRLTEAQRLASAASIINQDASAKTSPNSKNSTHSMSRTNESIVRGTAAPCS